MNLKRIVAVFWAAVGGVGISFLFALYTAWTHHRAENQVQPGHVIPVPATSGPGQ